MYLDCWLEALVDSGVFPTSSFHVWVKCPQLHTLSICTDAKFDSREVFKTEMVIHTSCARPSNIFQHKIL